MKAIKLLVIAAVLAISAPAFSQSVEFGVKAGVNLASASLKVSGEKADDVKMKPGLNIGVFADFNFSDLLGLETGLQFEQKGYKLKEENQGISVNDKVNLNYLTIPVNLRLNLPVGDNKLYFLAGPTLGIGLSGKEKIEYEGSYNGMSAKQMGLEDEDGDIEFGDDGIKRMNLGLLFGAGFDLSSNLGIRVSYDLGLSNLTDADDSSFKTNAFSVALTFKF